MEYCELKTYPTKVSKGIAFVQYARPDSAADALELNDYEFPEGSGNYLSVEYSELLPEEMNYFGAPLAFFPTQVFNESYRENFDEKKEEVYRNHNSAVEHGKRSLAMLYNPMHVYSSLYGLSNAFFGGAHTAQIPMQYPFTTNLDQIPTNPAASVTNCDVNHDELSSSNNRLFVTMPRHVHDSILGVSTIDFDHSRGEPKIVRFHYTDFHTCPHNLTNKYRMRLMAV